MTAEVKTTKTMTDEEKVAARARRSAEIRKQMEEAYYEFPDLNMCVAGIKDRDEARRSAIETIAECEADGIVMRAPIEKNDKETQC